MGNALPAIPPTIGTTPVSTTTVKPIVNPAMLEIGLGTITAGSVLNVMVSVIGMPMMMKTMMIATKMIATKMKMTRTMEIMGMIRMMNTAVLNLNP
jgi:hypothetical protein